jgi:hypothetical protein
MPVKIRSPEWCSVNQIVQNRLSGFVKRTDELSESNDVTHCHASAYEIQNETVQFDPRVGSFVSKGLN